MNKYIDAGKLISEIKGIISAVQTKNHPDALGTMEQCLAAAEIEALNLVLDDIDSLSQEQPEKPTKKNCNNCPHCIDRKDQIGWHFRGCFGGQYKGKPIAEIEECPLQQEQPEVDLEKFTEKMNDWKARYNHPDNISIKATMAFTARMFYQYPNVARQWYEQLPNVTMD